MNLHCLKASNVGASFTRIVGDDISATCDSSSIGTVFFRSEHAYSASIGDNVTSGYLVFVDEGDSIRAFDIARKKPPS